MFSLLKLNTAEIQKLTKYRHPPSHPNVQNAIAVNCCSDILTGDSYSCPHFMGDDTEKSAYPQARRKEVQAGVQTQSF